eukprot:Skav214471  [mRNA]  locus=scaffold1167:138580:145014:+ [translate_table: standard]
MSGGPLGLVPIPSRWMPQFRRPSPAEPRNSSLNVAGGSLSHGEILAVDRISETCIRHGPRVKQLTICGDDMGEPPVGTHGLGHFVVYVVQLARVGNLPSEVQVMLVEYAALDAWVTLRLFYLDGYSW